jgi:predicted nucleotide-binding protein
MRAAIIRFARRIGELQSFEPQGVRSRSDPTIRTLEVAIDEALTEAFGHETPEYRRYSAASNLDRASINYLHGTPIHEVIEGLEAGKAEAIALLGQATRSFEEKLADIGDTPSPEPSGIVVASASRDVFVVHGQDESAKQEVARLIERAGLTAVILHEQANAGKTIIEKFEMHGGAAGFAVVILTPDDVGGSDAVNLHPRARQNVVGEMFWFAGRLGRSRVCALKKGDVEMPSDFAGVSYTSMDAAGAWKASLLKELAAAGYDVDWKNALS